MTKFLSTMTKFLSFGQMTKFLSTITKFLSFGQTTRTASEESSTVASEDGVVVSEQSPTDVSVYTALALWYELIGYRITDVDGKWTVSLFFMDIDSNPGMVTELRTSNGAYHRKGVHICESDWQHYPSDIENPYDLPEGTVFVKPNRYWVLPPYRYIVSSTTGDHLLDDQCDFRFLLHDTDTNTVSLLLEGHNGVGPVDWTPVDPWDPWEHPHPASYLHFYGESLRQLHKLRILGRRRLLV